MSVDLCPATIPLQPAIQRGPRRFRRQNLVRPVGSGASDATAGEGSRHGRSGCGGCGGDLLLSLFARRGSVVLISRDLAELALPAELVLAFAAA